MNENVTIPSPLKKQAGARQYEGSLHGFRFKNQSTGCSIIRNDLVRIIRLGLANFLFGREKSLDGIPFAICRYSSSKLKHGAQI